MQLLLVFRRGPMRRQFFGPAHFQGILDHTTHDVHFALSILGGTPTGVVGSVRRGTIFGGESPLREGNLALLTEFADLITGRVREADRVGATLRQGAHAVAVTEALARSVETGRRIAPAELAAGERAMEPVAVGPAPRRG